MSILPEYAGPVERRPLCRNSTTLKPLGRRSSDRKHGACELNLCYPLGPPARAILRVGRPPPQRTDSPFRHAYVLPHPHHRQSPSLPRRIKRGRGWQQHAAMRLRTTCSLSVGPGMARFQFQARFSLTCLTSPCIFTAVRPRLMALLRLPRSRDCAPAVRSRHASLAPSYLSMHVFSFGRPHFALGRLAPLFVRHGFGWLSCGLVSA